MPTHTRSRIALTISAILVAAVPGLAAGELTSRLLTKGEYTLRIEGPAVDAAGNLYVMNLGTDGVIGRLSPGTTKSVPFTKLPEGGIGGGARFDREGRMYVADFKNHKLFVFEPGQATPRVYSSHASPIRPASSISRTMLQWRPTVPSMSAIRSGWTAPAGSGELRAGRTERFAAR